MVNLEPVSHASADHKSQKRIDFSHSLLYRICIHDCRLDCFLDGISVFSGRVYSSCCGLLSVLPNREEVETKKYTFFTELRTNKQDRQTDRQAQTQAEGECQDRLNLREMLERNQNTGSAPMKITRAKATSHTAKVEDDTSICSPSSSENCYPHSHRLKQK